jgi:hypothetical protein
LDDFLSTVETERSYEDVIDDVRDFFLHQDHWVYKSKGTPSLIGPNSVYHSKQLQILFEDRHFHFRTDPALRYLRDTGFLESREVSVHGSSAILMWRANVRYVERAIRAHTRLMLEYSSEAMNRATGEYAETLALLGLRGLQLNLVDRNSRTYKRRK